MSTDPHPIEAIFPKVDTPEKYLVRGVGIDYELPCLVTGAFIDVGPNISGFVRNLDHANRLVRLLGGRARIDYRPSEPHRIQVKIGAHKDHAEVLHRLSRVVTWCGNIIDREHVLWAIEPEWFRGYQPYSMRYADQERERLEASAQPSTDRS